MWHEGNFRWSSKRLIQNLPLESWHGAARQGAAHTLGDELFRVRSNTHRASTTTKIRQPSRRGVEALMVFTVLATLLFKVYPKLKPIQIAANASVLGGLALYHICSR